MRICDSHLAVQPHRLSLFQQHRPGRPGQLRHLYHLHKHCFEYEHYFDEETVVSIQSVLSSFLPHVLTICD